MSPFITFRCTTVSGKTRTFTFRHPAFVVGRAEDCGFRIALPDVSRRHCLIELDEFGVAFTDLRPPRASLDEPRPEIRQNGESGSKGMITVGDELFIGSTQLLLVDYAGYAALEKPDEPPAEPDHIQMTDSTLMPAVHASATGTHRGLSPRLDKPLKNAWDGILEGAPAAPRRLRRTMDWISMGNVWRHLKWSAGLIFLGALVYLVYLGYKQMLG